MPGNPVVFLRSSFLALFLAVLCRLHLVVFHVSPMVALLLPMRRREFTIGDAGAYFPRFPRSSKVTLKQQQSRALDGQTFVLLCKIPHETGGTNERTNRAIRPMNIPPLGRLTCQCTGNFTTLESRQLNNVLQGPWLPWTIITRR